MGRRRWLRSAFGVGLGAALARPAWAAPGGLPAVTPPLDEWTPQWRQLQQALWPGRTLRQGKDVVTLKVPLRAAFGAAVPVDVRAVRPQTPGPAVRRLHLVVDKNPSPLALSLTLGDDIGRADLQTRLRVDEYSHVRVVAELEDGSLHTDSGYVKTSGGCSAPPNRDAPQRIGETVLRRIGAPGSGPDGLGLAEVTVIHPNDTGFEMNHQTVMTIPPHFVRTLRVSHDGRRVFDAEMDFSVSENPTLRFPFVERPGTSTLHAEVVDSKDQRFRGALEVRA